MCALALNRIRARFGFFSPVTQWLTLAFCFIRSVSFTCANADNTRHIFIYIYICICMPQSPGDGMIDRVEPRVNKFERSIGQGTYVRRPVPPACTRRHTRADVVSASRDGGTRIRRRQRAGSTSTDLSRPGRARPQQGRGRQGLLAAAATARAQSAGPAGKQQQLAKSAHTHTRHASLSSRTVRAPLARSLPARVTRGIGIRTLADLRCPIGRSAIDRARVVCLLARVLIEAPSRART